jgi:predicted O-linked N-acetylglucosamine transferase (SPINDLY family)
MKKTQKRSSNINDLMQEASLHAHQGKLNEAHAAGLRALAQNPESIDALYLVGSIDLTQRRYQDGAQRLEKLLKLCPSHVDALNNYGLYKFEQSRDARAALVCFEDALRQQPSNLNALFNVGCVHLAINELDEAGEFFTKTLEIDPCHVGALNNMGAVQARKGRRDLALPYYRRALEICPNDTDVMANLLTSALATGDTKLALELFQTAYTMPDPGAAIFPSFSLAKMMCLWDEVDKLLPEVVRRILDGRCTLSSFETVNLPLLAAPKLSRKILFEIHKKSGEVIGRLGAEAPLPPLPPVALPADGRLRIGYLSPDFRSHVVNAFSRGLINHHDRDRFEIHCYSNTRVEDEITEQYRATADFFVNVTGLSDAQLVERIRADGIHILVDLAGYTQNSRTPALRLRAAPIQIMYLGYPYTSGIPEIDYFVSDPWLDGPANAACFTERQLRLPESFITFDELHDQSIDPVTPMDRNGYITFGSMNATYKTTPDAIAAWAGIMKAVPGSRMVINHPNCGREITREHILREFSRHDVDPTRVSIIWDKHPGGSHLHYYNDYDIMLDTFPQTGGTTTIDALWMGVPVVTLVGDIYPERLSYSILNNVGMDLDDLLAFSGEEYFARAVALARNPERLRELRQRIPAALRNSILCDPVRLTRHMEEAFIRAWNEKFPESRTCLVPEDGPVNFVAVSHDTTVAVSGNADDLVSYVLQEQEGWFDPEYRFVLDLIQPGATVLDINAGHGAYALPMARRSAPGTVLATTECPRDGLYLERGKLNQGAFNLDILIKGDRRLRIDDEMARRNIGTVSFVRVNIQFNAKAVLADGKTFFQEQSPLVMFSIKRGRDQVDPSLASTFNEWGYDIYRYVPGLELLAPWSGPDELDSFALNLFACKADRAQELAVAGLLGSALEQLESFPGVQDGDWAGFLADYPYAGRLVSTWTSRMIRFKDWEAYWSAMNLYARSMRKEARPSQRLASLNTCIGILVMLAQASPTIPRLLSLARALSDAGRRQQAAQVLQQLAGMLEHGGFEDEPFLAACPRLESVDPGPRLAEWILCSVLEQFERLRAFSSYFGGMETLQLLESLVATGFASEEMSRRLHLVKARLKK